MNLVEALLEANNKSREFIRQLDETSRLLPDSPHDGTAISKAITQGLIDATEKAIASGDVVQMLAAAEAHGIGQPGEDDDS